MKFLCSQCGQLIEAANVPPGASLPCPVCGQNVTVPRTSPRASAVSLKARAGGRRAKATPLAVKLFAVLLLLAAGGFAGAMYWFQESPGQTWTRATNFVAFVGPTRPAATPPPTAAQPVVAANTPAPVIVAATPPPEAMPPPPEPADPVMWLAAHRPRWPKEVALTREVSVPVIYDGRQAGTGNVPVGSSVQLISIEPPDATVAYLPYGGAHQRVPIAATTLLASARTAMMQADPAMPVAAASPAPVSPTPADASTPASPESTPADVAANPPPSAPPAAPAIVPLTGVSNALDTLVFGSATSEKNHALVANNSVVCQNELTLYGPGDIFNSQDTCIFRHQHLSGDGWIQARVVCTGETSNWTKVGVMMRESLDAKARNAFAFDSAGNGSHSQWRGDTGGGTGQGDIHGLPDSGPFWFRVERKGNTFTMSASADGTHWIAGETQKIAMGPHIFIGLVNSASSLDKMNYASFDHITSSAGDAPWTDSDIGKSPLHGGSMATGLGEPSRRLLPQEPKYYYGGDMTFRMKVDPDKQNYCTVKLWGSEGGGRMGRIVLDCEGKEVGQRHGPGLDIFIHTDGPATPGSFWYRTTLLPRWLTKGKTSVEIKLRSTGDLFAYGKIWDYDTYQMKLDRPTRGLYRLYTHTNPMLSPGAEVQGVVPDYAHAPVHPAPDEKEEIDKRKTDGNARIADLLKKSDPDQNNAATLAEAYGITWTVGYKKGTTLAQIIKGLDDTCRKFHSDPKLAGSEWGGKFGPAGYALALAASEMRSALDEKVDLGGGAEPRREQYAAMLKASRDSGRFGRQGITAQAIINATNVYRANRGMLALGAKDAIPDEQAKRYPREAFGMEEWKGDDLPNGGSKWNIGHGVLMMTAKGTSHEWNWCCANCYGRMDPYAYEFYRLTGDTGFRDRAIQIERARKYMLYPSVDEGGYRTMLNEGVICTRNVYHPGHTFYGNVNTASSLSDKAAVGNLRQAMADHQFFEISQISEIELYFPDDYAKVKGAPPTVVPLPTTPGQPDFVWADEQNAVLSIKHGAEQHFVTFARRASSIHHIGDAHSITPQGERVVQFWVDDVRFVPSGEVEKFDGRVESEFCGVPPDKPVSAWDGQVQPKAKPDFGMPGGIADFYSARYGDYLIAMNCSWKKTFEFKPEGAMGGVDMVSGKKVLLPAQVPPQTTMVFYSPAKPGS